MSPRGKDKILGSFPPALAKVVREVSDMLGMKESDVSGSCYRVRLEGVDLAIPERIYTDDRTPLADLTDVQRGVMDCLFTRHHDGFVRQRHLRNLALRTEYWVTPFCFRLLGEYVYEMLSDVRRHIDGNLENYLRFIGENEKFFDRTKSQMISYWDCYYRTRFPIRASYIGFAIFNELKMAYGEWKNLPLKGG